MKLVRIYYTKRNISALSLRKGTFFRVCSGEKSADMTYVIPATTNVTRSGQGIPGFVFIKLRQQKGKQNGIQNSTDQ